MTAWRLALRLAIATLGVLALSAAIAGLLPRGSAVWELAVGARGALVVGGGAAVLAIVVGAALGASAAWSGGLWDSLVTRSMEVLMTFPGVALVAVALAVWPHAPTWGWVALLALTRLPEAARLTRGHVLRLSGSEMMVAARAVGASPARLLVRHAGPHLAAPLAHAAVFSVGAVVAIDAAMTAVGLGGAGWPTSWGARIAAAVASGNPTAALSSACALTVTVASLLVLAEAVRRRTSV